MLDSGSVQSIGRIVPDYELLQRIGAGAYGEVWLARSKATRILRAAKIVWRHRFDHDRPFQREFEGIQSFERVSREHPSQLALFHIGRNEAEGCFYYVMELADNIGTADDYVPRTLRADLANGRLPVDRVLDISVALTKALGHLHQNGLVHRDVKPSNVIFVNGRPKLADIGLVTDASDSRSIVGTEGYLPPEGPGTPQADIFALGKVLYEAVTGLDRREFPKLPEDLRTWPDAAPVFELNEITLKACASDLKQRYQSCQEMQADLALLERGESVQRRRMLEWFSATGKRVGLGMAVLAALAAGIVTLVQLIPPSNAYPEGPPSTNADATMLCEKGMLIMRADNTEKFAQACTNFQRAIALDPHFARPYVGLLELRVRDFGPSSPEEMRLLAEQLRNVAPRLAATHCAQAIVHWFDWSFPQAEQCARQAIRADPNYELGHTWYGFMLCTWGRPVEGRAQLTNSLALKPSKVTIYRCIGQSYYVQRDYTNCIFWQRKALELEPHHGGAFLYLAAAQEAMGDYARAIDSLEQPALASTQNESATRGYYDGLRRALAAAGVRGYWQEMWREAEQNPSGAFYQKAVIQIHLGNTNAAFVWLNKSCDTHERNGGAYESHLNYLLQDHSWNGLHDHARFKAILDRIGFTKVMPRKKQVLQALR